MVDEDLLDHEQDMSDTKVIWTQSPLLGHEVHGGYDLFSVKKTGLVPSRSSKPQNLGFRTSGSKVSFVGIIANVLSLMETYLIKMSTLW